MANTPTDSQQQKQQTQPITYSPPNHSIEDIDKPPIVLVPTLTPPHVVAHQHSPSYSHSTTATPSSLNDPANQQTTSTNSVTSTTHFTMTTTDVMKQHLPPRKRIQSLKKQFTKPNLSAPVIPSSQSIISEPNDTLPTKEAAMVVPSVDQPINEITTTTNSSHNSSRSSSPLVNIEDDSGETTETDDEDYFHQQQQNKKRHKDDTTYDDEDDIGSGQSKQTVIIQPATTITTPSAVSKKPTVTSMQKTKKPLKKHWTKTKNILESSDVLPTDRQDNIHPSSSSLSPWAPDEKPKKVRKKKGRPPISNVSEYSKSTPDAVPSKPRRSGGGRPSKASLAKSGALYCICQTPYDVPRFMIACDRCDQWFHGECIGISEKEGEFIDLYFCDVCGKETGKTTSWKPQCGNPACSKAARIGSHQGYISKYCSHNCGMQVARARLELNEMKRRLAKGGDGGSTIENIPQLIIKQQRQSRLTSYAEKEDQHRLGQLRIQKQKAQDMVKMIEQKQKFLATVEKRMEQITDDICGFDTRLVWDDLLWQDDVIMDEHSQQQCQIKRKECQRHQQWQNIIQLGLNQERKEQIQVLKMLDKEKQDIKTRMHKRRNEIELANGLKNHTFII